MIKKFLVGLGLTLSLSACEVPVMMAASQNQGEMTGMFEITFPAVMLVAFDEGSEELLTGKLIGHANGSAKYDLTGPEWGHCTGGFSQEGISTLTCENGMTATANIGKQRPKMSGVEVYAGQGLGQPFVSAFGWGNDANEAAVRGAVAEYRLAAN